MIKRRDWSSAKTAYKPLFYLEWVLRLLLVNFQTYLLSHFRELDSICSIAATYILSKSVGLSWAVFANSSFGFAIKLSNLLPPLSCFLSRDGLDPHAQAKVSSECDKVDEESSYYYMASFYVSYATIRVIYKFAIRLLNLALQSTKDWPAVRKAIANGGLHAMNNKHVGFYHILLCLILQIYILSADFVCCSDNIVCSYSGLLFFTTTKYPYNRKIVLYSFLIMVIQLWQFFLHEFPSWNRAFNIKYMSYFTKIIFQSSMFLLICFWVSMPVVKNMYSFTDSQAEYMLAIIMFGFTFWLYCFASRLVNTPNSDFNRNSSLEVGNSPNKLNNSPDSPNSKGQIYITLGNEWDTKVKDSQKGEKALHDLVRYMRLSQMGILLFIFLSIFWRQGFVQAQLDLTFISIIISIFFNVMYALARLHGQNTVGEGRLSNVFLYSKLTLLSIVGSVILTKVVAKNESKGCVLLVAIHLFNKGYQFYFGNSSSSISKDPNKSGLKKAPSFSNFTIGGIRLDGSASSDSLHDIIMKDKSSDNANGDVSISSDNNRKRNSDNNSSSSSSSSSSSTIGTSHSIDTVVNSFESPKALVDQLRMREIRKHWLVVFCGDSFRFFLKIFKYWLAADSVYGVVINFFLGISLFISISLFVFSFGSIAQSTTNRFPKLMDIHVTNDTIIFDHIISNATLRRSKPDLYSSKNTCQFSEGEADHLGPKTCQDGSGYSKTLEPPMYSLCSWNTNSVSLFDFAMLAEIAYLDARDKEHVQRVVNEIFPRHEFLVDYSSAYNTSGPKFFIFESQKYDISIVSIRGTDPGRLHDFLEDVKLFGEPVICSLLSLVFPTIRMWSSDTFSSVIKWLYEINSFFGLQGSAEYYEPLVEQLQKIKARKNGRVARGKGEEEEEEEEEEVRTKTGKKVVLTGHSLGGGLARIVASLTGTASVTFSPPGLGLSYKKYSTLHGSNDKVDSSIHINKNMLHHNSVSVITEFDLVPQVDRQVGLVQMILCDKVDQSHQNACHMLEGTICNIMSHCGDDDDRFTSCEFTFNIDAFSSIMMDIFYPYRYILYPVVVSIFVWLILATLPDML